jgi:hypothetical protein
MLVTPEERELYLQLFEDVHLMEQNKQTGSLRPPVAESASLHPGHEPEIVRFPQQNALIPGIKSCRIMHAPCSIEGAI